MAQSKEEIARNEVLVFFAVVFVVVAVVVWGGVLLDPDGVEARRDFWRGYVARNPVVEMIAVTEGSFYHGKLRKTTQTIVELRGIKTGEIVVVRERNDRISMSPAPKQGQKWRMWVDESVDSLGHRSLSVRMEILAQ